MSKWQPIATAPDDDLRDFIVWNGVKVTVAWRGETGIWHKSIDADPYVGTPLDPQPTEWTEWPEPPHVISS